MPVQKRFFKDLTIEDFPGVDRDGFMKWKKAKVNSMRNSFIILGVIAVIFISAKMELVDFGAIEWFMLAGCAAFLPNIPYIRANRLAKKINLSDKMILAALKGESAPDA